jgi:uncharacterized protein YndB with AHSA1/START domain
MNHIIKFVGLLNAKLPSARELNLTRHFKAPRQLVWDCHTQPVLIRRWLLGPPGWTMPVCEVDLRVGGKYRYEWHSEGGLAMAMSGVYREIAAPERLSDTQTFDDNWTQGPADTTLLLFDEAGGTRLDLTILYASEAVRDFALSTPMMEGMEAGYERLDELS